MSAHFEATLETAMAAITYLFIFEFLLKLGGLGWRGYW